MSRRQRCFHALKLKDELIEIWGECKAHGRPEPLRRDVDVALERLLAFLLSEFRGEVDLAQMNKLVLEAKPVTVDLLETVSDGMVTFAVMREVLYKHRVLFNPKQVGHYQEFSKRYLQYLLKA